MSTHILNRTLKGAVVVICAAALSLIFIACQKKGPFEKAGEKIDEAGRTIENGGEKTTTDKINDKLDEARDNVQDASDKAKKELKKAAK